MTDDSYTLAATDLVLTHSVVPPSLLGDHAENHQNDMAIDALVASGDCFVTLATQLDQIDHADLTDAQPELETVIRSLLYLQRHYQIAKKQPTVRE